MGTRRLRHWLLNPLRQVGAINARQDAVEALVGDPEAHLEVRSRLLGFTSPLGRGRPVLPAAQRGAACPVDHPYRGPLLLLTARRFAVAAAVQPEGSTWGFGAGSYAPVSATLPGVPPL
eukprot:7390121-Pyramimonas_sp.AAC.1